MRITSPCPVTLIGGAKTSRTDLDEALRYAPKLVAADGGANTLLREGLTPEAVFGDMDSISPQARAAFEPVVHQVSEQQSTDFDKALRHIDAPLILGLGVAGGRLDHELAGLHVLVAYPDRPCVMLGAESLAFVCPSDVALDLPMGSPVSLFPFAAVRVVSEGLQWPTADLTLDPIAQIGTSNQVTGPVRLMAKAPDVIVILPRAALAVVVTAFAAAPARWPFRAQ